MKEEKSKNIIKMIIKVLLTGKALQSKEIADLVTEETGKEVSVQDIASMISRISNPDKSPFGHFVQKTPKGRGFIYNIVDEIRNLSQEQVYDLTRKTGKDRFTLEMAIEQFPSLAQYVDETGGREKTRGRRAGRKPAKKLGRKPGRKPGKRMKKEEIEVEETVSVEAETVEAEPIPVEPRKRGPKKIEPRISKTSDMFRDLEKLAVRLKDLDGSDSSITDIDVKVSFKFQKSGD